MRVRGATRCAGLGLVVACVLVPASAELRATKLVPPDLSSGTYFGITAALDGDTAVVGATWAEYGAAYVYVRSGEDWTLQQKLGTSAANDLFGYGVALQGDTLAVSASMDTTSSYQAGSVYVFTRSGTTWTQQAKLVASDPQEGRYFGNALALDGETLIVGHSMHGITTFGEGAAYVFVRSNGAWTEQAKLTAPDAVTEDDFGHAVALSGDTLLVGAQARDDNGAGSGAVYVFTRSGANWSLQQKLLASDGASGDVFGAGVAVSGDRALIGAYADDDLGNSSGSFYAFDRAGSVWSQTQKIHASDAGALSWFGYALDISGDRAVVSSIGGGPAGSFNGALYTYVRSGGTWQEERVLTDPDGGAGGRFGASSAISGTTVLVGTPYSDAQGTDSGAAWIFEEGPAVTTANLIPEKVTLTLPLKSTRPVKPGLTSTGVFDTGPDPVDLSQQFDLHVSGWSAQVPGLTRGKDGRTWSASGTDYTFSVRTPSGGGSRCTFDLRISGDLTGKVSPEGFLPMGFETPGADASAMVRLEGGKFRLSNAPDALGPSFLGCVTARAKLVGPGRDTFSATLRFGGSGEVPDAPPRVTIGFCDTVPVVLDAAKMRMGKGKARGTCTFRDPKTSGVWQATFDFARGTVKFAAKRCTVGQFAQGAVPLTITVGVDDDIRAVKVRASVRGRALKY